MNKQLLAMLASYAAVTGQNPITSLKKKTKTASTPEDFLRLEKAQLKRERKEIKKILRKMKNPVEK